jgi:predicted nucleotidyltransferase
MGSSPEVLEGLSEELRQGIQRAAAALKAAGAREVYLFGSVAKGRLREGSDIDLAVVGLPPRVFFRAMADAHEALGRQLDLIDLDEESDFVRYLREHGELVRVG